MKELVNYEVTYFKTVLLDGTMADKCQNVKTKERKRGRQAGSKKERRKEREAGRKREGGREGRKEGRNGRQTERKKEILTFIKKYMPGLGEGLRKRHSGKWVIVLILEMLFPGTLGERTRQCVNMAVIKMCIRSFS